MELKTLYNIQKQRAKYAEALKSPGKGDWYQMMADYRASYVESSDVDIEVALWCLCERFYAPAANERVGVMNDIAMAVCMWHWILKDVAVGGKVSRTLMDTALDYKPPKDALLWPILAHTVPHGVRAAISVHVDGKSVSPASYSVGFSDDAIHVHRSGKSYTPLWCGLEFIATKKEEKTLHTTCAVFVCEIDGKEHKVYVAIPPCVPTNIVKGFATAYETAAKRASYLDETDMFVGLASCMRLLV